MTRRSVQAGFCEAQSAASHCALEGADCTPGSTWLSSRQIQGRGNSHGGVCATRAGTEDTAVGFCSGRCVSDSTACQDSSEFITALSVYDSDRECTIKLDNDPQKATLFGSCDGECFWSKDDCASNGSTWSVAGANPSCTCENVRVGACINEGFHWCAVSPTSCDDGSQWISAKDLMASGDGVECYLCRDLNPVVPDNPPPTPAPVTQNDSPTGGNGGGGVDDTSEDIAGLKSSCNSDDPNAGLIVGCVLGGVVGICVIVFAVLMLRRSSKPRYNPNKTVSDIPTSTEHVAAQHVDPSEDLSDDGESITRV
mmetsp:Transcript_500/g.1166  ORF Transcript_500/g.1166 Transcript_500/m.1166 type:complete len:311 (+) Transcript_500:134-1066(+)